MPADDVESRIISLARFKRRKSGKPLKGIGLCAAFSMQGDWAFDYALTLARAHRVRLNIFHVLDSPYKLRRDVVFVDAEHTKTAQATPALLAEKEKEFRQVYDERLGDYVDVGFRLCEGTQEWELRKCLRRGEYDILVMGYEKVGAAFGEIHTIEEFAGSFRSPVVLVGTDAPDSFHINRLAEEWLDLLMIPDSKWKIVSP